MTNRLDIAMLYRPSVGDRKKKIPFKTGRHTVDFLVNGFSLFAATKAAERDMCGCFSPDYATCGNKLAERENDRLAKIFTFELPGEIAPDRPALFICPQCSDLGCGAITFRLSRAGDKVRWSDFGYENNYDEAYSDFESFVAIGPFEFDIEAYLAAISRAASADPLIGCPSSVRK
jgi:hypothetical protein